MRCSPIVGLLCFAVASAHAATLTVINTNDNAAGSLRQAIADAAAGDTIVFNIPTSDPNYNSAAKTWTIKMFLELAISRNLTIDARGQGIRIQQQSVSSPNEHIFHIVSGNVLLNGLWLSDGQGFQTSSPDIGAVGGAIFNEGALTITNCTLTNNNATTGGGAIYNYSGSLTATNCTFTGNSSPSRAAAIWNRAALTLTHCTIAGNSCGGSNVAAAVVNDGGTVHVASTVIAQNSNSNLSQTDVGGSAAFASDGYNLIGVAPNGSGFGTQGSHDQVGAPGGAIAPMLNPLSSAPDHPIPVMVPQSGSPLIDQAIANGILQDERGYPRPLDVSSVVNAGGGDGSDIGAAEVDILQGGSRFVVTTSDEHSDGFCGVGDCSLWDAMNAANNAVGSNVEVDFAPNVTGIITTALQTTGMNVLRSMTIVGPGSRVLAISGVSAGRMFNVANGVQLIISDLNLYSGRTPAAGSSGGAVYNGGGDVTLSDCMLNANYAVDAGSQTHFGGAAIYNAAGTLRLNRCTFLNNSATGGVGGGVDNNTGATLFVNNCTFVSNSALNGGAIYSFGGSVTVNSSTFVFNSGSASGGVGAINIAGGTASISNSIVAQNLNTNGTLTFNDMAGANFQGDYNLLSTNTGYTFAAGQGTHDIFSNDPRVDPAGVTNNGGPTDTLAILADSPAINAANPATALPRDQRLAQRGSAPDIGAFELNGVPFAVTSIMRSGTDIIVSFAAFTGEKFQLQRELQIGTSQWQSIGSVLSVAGSGPAQLTDVGGVTLGHAFYRVSILP